MSSRKHYLSPAHVFSIIRNQLCFDENTNIQIRAAIRAEAPFAMQYSVDARSKHKYDLDGYSTSKLHQNIKLQKLINDGEIALVKRFSGEQLGEICLNLKFKCPICNSRLLRDNYRSHVFCAIREGTTIVCLECHRDNLAIAKHQLNLLSKMVRLLNKNGDVTDEEYERITRRSYSGFDRPEVGKNNASRSKSASVSSEEYHRYVETGGGGINNADRQFPASLAATHEAIFRRCRIMLERYS